MLDILMSIFDFLPVVAFLVGAVFLQRDLYNKMSKGAFAVFSTGTIFVFVAGIFKAFYKILFYSNVCNFDCLNKTFFPIQSTGFILAGIGILAAVLHKQGVTAYSVSLPIAIVFLLEEFSGTMIFVVVMILGVLILDACLIYVSTKVHSKVAIILYAISFVFVLGMGYLSSRPDITDWVKEIVNTIAQGSFLAAAIVLRKKGLGKLPTFTRAKA